MKPVEERLQEDEITKPAVNANLLIIFGITLIAVMGVAVYKILVRNKRDAEARREAYREKFEKKSGIR